MGNLRRQHHAIIFHIRKHPLYKIEKALFYRALRIVKYSLMFQHAFAFLRDDLFLQPIEI
jgi:hypothetical protein